MPRFEMPIGTKEEGLAFAALDRFTQGYIEALFFTDGTGSEDALEGASFADLSPEALDRIKADCALFQEGNAGLLDMAYQAGLLQWRGGSVQPYNAERAGNDYWYTRCGHGTGFWDRGLAAVGDELAAAASNSPVNPYIGADGLIYLE